MAALAQWWAREKAAFDGERAFRRVHSLVITGGALVLALSMVQ